MRAGDRLPEEIYRDAEVIRSNRLILSMQDATLTERKITALAFHNAVRDEIGRPKAVMTTKELKNLMGRDDGGLYTQLKKIADGMTQRRIFMESVDLKRKERKFMYLNIVNKAIFQNGKYEVVFTPEIGDELDRLKGNFTRMSLGILCSLSSIYAYQLYEILETKKYQIPEDNSEISISYGLSELRLRLSCVNVQDPEVEEEMKKKNPDYDHIVNHVAKKRKFTKWADFKKNVLDIAEMQINEKSDIHVRYEYEGSGRGGKVDRITFFIRRNEEFKDDDVKKPENDQDAFERVLDGIEIKLTATEIRSLLKAAEGDADRVLRAYEISKKQSEIRNFMAWMIEAIKQGYEDNEILVIDGSEERGRQIEAIQKDYEENRHAIAGNLWEKIKNKDDFQDFCKDEALMDISDLELIYEPEELTNMYLDWKKAKTVV